MASKKKNSAQLFRRLSRLFKTDNVRNKLRNTDTLVAVPDKTKSSGALLFQKSVLPSYAVITGNAYSLAERLPRFQDYQEMDHMTPEISATLDIVSDETVSVDDKGISLRVYSNDEKIKETLEDLFYNAINVEFNLRSWTRNLAKFGDLFLYIDVHPDEGVLRVVPVPVNEIEREENFDKNDPFSVRFKWVSLGNKTLENWEIAHFRLLGNDTFLPYGTSMIEGARRIWRQLILAEDAMLVYRVVRAPERRVFYIDVGNLASEEVEAYMQKQKQQLRNSAVIDRETGRSDLRYNPLGIEEDYFIATRGGNTGTKIDTLAGGQNSAAVEDVVYLQKKLIAALKIPRSYLGYEEDSSCLTGDTLIPCTNGKAFTMEQLAAMSPAELSQHKVYSLDYINGKKPSLIEQPIKKAWKTRETKELYHITLDDGTIIKCTANHPFLLRDGRYVRADSLKVSDSCAALYNKETEGKYPGYKMYSVCGSSWKVEHRTFAKQKYGDIKGYVVHHVDFDKKNNTGDNLLLMTSKAHQRLHALMNKLNKTYVGKHNPNWNDDVSVDDIINVAQSGLVSSQQEFADTLNCSIGVLLRRIKSLNLSWQQFADAHVKTPSRGRYRCVGYDTLPITFSDVVDVVQNLHIHNRDELARHFNLPSSVVLVILRQNGYNSWGDFKRKFIWGLTQEKLADGMLKYQNFGLLYEKEYRQHCSMTAFSKAFRNLLGHAKKFKTANDIDQNAVFNQRFAAPLNHSIVKIEIVTVETPIAVYDLEVDVVRENQYVSKHNFGVQCNEGLVFVHNSKSSLAQLDIRFSRTISVIQRTLISELNKIAMIHLFTKGFSGEDLSNFTLKLNNPSTIAQQQKLELWRAKAEIANSFPDGLISRKFIRREILAFDENDIKDLDEDRMQEKLLDMLIDAAVPEELENSSGGGGEASEKSSSSGGGGGSSGGSLFGGDEGPSGAPGGEDLGLGGETGAAGSTEAPGGGEEEAEPNEEIPGEENSDTSAEEENDGLELLTSADDKDEDISFKLKLQSLSDEDKRSPVKPSKQVKRFTHNNKRHRHHGSNSTAMPDHFSMLDVQNRDNRDVFGKSFIQKMVSNPLGENFDKNYVKPSVSLAEKSMLGKLDSYLNKHKSKKKPNILFERNNELDENSDLKDEIIELHEIDED